MKIDAVQFDKVARDIFKPVYPVIAEQIINNTGIAEGNLLDIGCGGGYLGIALARYGDFFIRFLDQSPEMLDIVKGNIAEIGLEDHTEMIKADVAAIPLPDNSIDLAVSRGSLFFWQELIGAFQEIRRVLVPGGMAYIGGGFGTARLKEEIGQKMRECNKGNPQWDQKVKRNIGPDAPKKFEAILKQAEITDYKIIHNDEEGFWIVMRK